MRIGTSINTLARFLTNRGESKVTLTIGVADLAGYSAPLIPQALLAHIAAVQGVSGARDESLASVPDNPVKLSGLRG